jgi:molybdate transport system ATP-binding protein
VRILARDVSLAITRHSGTSIQNILPGVVETLADDNHPALALVRVNVGGVRLVARLTRRSAHDLGLTPGQIVYAQIKAVALMIHTGATALCQGTQPRVFVVWKT